MVCIFYKNNSISFFFYYLLTLLTLGAATPLSGLARHPGHLAADANKQHISSSPSACAIRPVEAHTRICQSPAQMPLPPSSPDRDGRMSRWNIITDYNVAGCRVDLLWLCAAPKAQGGSIDFDWFFIFEKLTKGFEFARVGDRNTRGEYRVVEAYEAKKKGKNYELKETAGFFFKKFCYEVFAKQKKRMNASDSTTSPRRRGSARRLECFLKSPI